MTRQCKRDRCMFFQVLAKIIGLLRITNILCRCFGPDKKTGLRSGSHTMSAPGASVLLCEYCQGSFASKNKLFKHLRSPLTPCGQTIRQASCSTVIWGQTTSASPHFPPLKTTRHFIEYTRLTERYHVVHIHRQLLRQQLHD